MKCRGCSGTGEAINWEAVQRGASVSKLLKRCILCGGTGRVSILVGLGQKIALWQFVRRHS